MSSTLFVIFVIVAAFLVAWALSDWLLRRRATRLLALMVADADSDRALAEEPPPA